MGGLGLEEIWMRRQMGHLGSRWHGKDIKNSQFAIRGATGRKNTAIESKMSQHPFKINEEPGKAEDKSDD